MERWVYFFLTSSKCVNPCVTFVWLLGPTEMMKCAVDGTTEHRSDFVVCPFHKGQWISSAASATEIKYKKMCQSSSICSEAVGNMTI